MPERGSDPRLVEAVYAFLHYVLLERGLAQNTVDAYRRDLERFTEFVSSQRVKNARAIQRKHITGFLESLERQGLSARSRARALVSVRRFVRFQEAEGEMSGEAIEGIAAPKLERALPKILSPAETGALIAAIDTTEPLGLRDRAMLETLYGAGLRVTELVGLPHAGVDLRSGLVRVLGKGSKERIVPLGAEALAAIEAYSTEGRPRLLNGKRTEYLFVTRRGSAMTRQNFFDRIRRHAVLAGLEASRVSPHVLRHAFATDLVDGGADLRAVQTMLGHADLSTTEIYTHVSRKHLRDTVDQRHPRGGSRSRRKGRTTRPPATDF